MLHGRAHRAPEDGRDDDEGKAQEEKAVHGVGVLMRCGNCIAFEAGAKPPDGSLFGRRKILPAASFAIAKSFL